MRKGLNIDSFKKGDVITRLEPANWQREAFNENLGVVVETDVQKDNSWLGEPLEFIGIENNVIYLKHLIGIFKDDISELRPHEGWSEGWGIYVDITNKLKS